MNQSEKHVSLGSKHSWQVKRQANDLAFQVKQVGQTFQIIDLDVTKKASPSAKTFSALFLPEHNDRVFTIKSADSPLGHQPTGIL
jgi:hypothetical protein